MIRFPLFLLRSDPNACQDGNYGGTCQESVFVPKSGANICIGDICGRGSSPPPHRQSRPVPPTGKKGGGSHKPNPVVPKKEPVKVNSSAEDIKVVTPPVTPEKPSGPPWEPPYKPGEGPPVKPDLPPIPPPSLPGDPPTVLPPKIPKTRIHIDFSKLFIVLKKLVYVGAAFNTELMMGAYNATGAVRVDGVGKVGLGHVFTPENWLFSLRCGYAGFIVERFGEEKVDSKSLELVQQKNLSFTHGFLCGGGIGRQFGSQSLMLSGEFGGAFRQSTPDSAEEKAGIVSAALLYSPFRQKVPLYFSFGAMFMTNNLTFADASVPDPLIYLGVEFLQ